MNKDEIPGYVRIDAILNRGLDLRNTFGYAYYGYSSDVGNPENIANPFQIETKKSQGSSDKPSASSIPPIRQAENTSSGMSSMIIEEEGEPFIVPPESPPNIPSKIVDSLPQHEQEAADRLSFRLTWILAKDEQNIDRKNIILRIFSQIIYGSPFLRWAESRINFSVCEQRFNYHFRRPLLEGEDDRIIEITQSCGIELDDDTRPRIGRHHPSAGKI